MFCNRQPDQRAKKWAEINLGSNPVFGSSQWITVSCCELLCGEILSVTMKYCEWEAVTQQQPRFQRSDDTFYDKFQAARHSTAWCCQAVLPKVFCPWRENKHQIGEITKHIQSVSLGCFDHAHEESARICTLIRRRKEKILTVDHKRLNGAFCKIICHFHFGMI